MHTSTLARFTEIGEQCCFILDVIVCLLTWDVFPNMVTAKSRKLYCGSYPLVIDCKKVLNQLCNRHMIFKKLLDIQESLPLLTSSKFMLLEKTWDKELKDYMKSADNQYQTFKGQSHQVESQGWSVAY